MSDFLVVYTIEVRGLPYGINGALNFKIIPEGRFYYGY